MVMARYVEEDRLRREKDDQERAAAAKRRREKERLRREAEKKKAEEKAKQDALDAKDAKPDLKRKSKEEQVLSKDSKFYTPDNFTDVMPKVKKPKQTAAEETEEDYQAMKTRKIMSDIKELDDKFLKE